MNVVEDKWHRLFFRQGGSSTDEEAEDQKKSCSCGKFDSIGNPRLSIMTLHQNCLVTPAILKNLITSVLSLGTPLETSFKMPHWIRFARQPETVFLVECKNGSDQNAFPMCLQHHLRYSPTGGSLLEDMFQSPVSERKRKSRSSYLHDRSLWKLKESRRDEEDVLIKGTLKTNRDRCGFILASTFQYDPKIFAMSGYERKALGLYEAGDLTIPEEFKKVHKRRHFSKRDASEKNYAMIRRSHLVALDCEMVITTYGYEVVRISVVDVASRKVLYDDFVRPKGKVVTYLTKYSGITKRTLENVRQTLEEARDHLLETVFFEDTIVVGHAVHNDLNKLCIAPKHIIDISLLYPKHLLPDGKNSPKKSVDTYHGKIGVLQKISAAEAKSLGIEGSETANSNNDVSKTFQLKLLAFWFLGRHIQSIETNKSKAWTGHCSVEDALACADLFRLKLEHGKDFGLDALLYFSTGREINGNDKTTTTKGTFDFDLVLERMRILKNIDSKYRDKEFRETFRQQSTEDDGNKLGGSKGLLGSLKHIDARFLWYESHEDSYGKQYHILPSSQRISRLRLLQEFLPQKEKGFVFLTLPEPPSNWNVVEFGNHLHEECQARDPQSPAPLVIFLTRDTEGALSVIFH